MESGDASPHSKGFRGQNRRHSGLRGLSNELVFVAITVLLDVPCFEFNENQCRSAPYKSTAFVYSLIQGLRRRFVLVHV